MKSFCKFAGLIATVVAFVAFILFMATPAATIDLGIGSLGKGSIKGIEGIFGGDGLSLPWAGLLAWLFVLIGFIIVALVSILPLLKVKALDKFSGILTFVAAALLIVGGIFAFCEKAAILGSDAKYVSDAVSLGAGWIVAGIMAIISGAIALLSKLLDK